jgi:hypothetical protein
MGSKRWWSVFGSLVGVAGVAAMVVCTGPSIRAAEPLDEVGKSRQVECTSVDPGFAYELEETLRGLDDPGFFPGGDGLGTPTMGGSVDPGFWQSIKNCPIGPLEDVLASPAAEIFGTSLTPTTTPSHLRHESYTHYDAIPGLRAPHPHRHSERSRGMTVNGGAALRVASYRKRPLR